MSAAALSDGLARLRGLFVSLLAERRAEIEVAVSSGRLDQAATVLHKLAGSSGSLGFRTLGELARSCEDLLAADHIRQGRLSKEGREALARFLIEASIVEGSTAAGQNPRSAQRSVIAGGPLNS